MNSADHIDPEDLALFALQLLSEEDMAAVRRHLDGCDACRTELAAVQGDLAIFAMTTEQQAPAPQSRDRLLNAISREPRSQTATALSERDELAAATPEPARTADTGAVMPFTRRDRDDRSNVEEPRRRGRALPWLGWAAAAGLAITSVELYRERQTLQNDIAAASRHSADLELQATNARRVQETLADASAVRVTLTRSKTAPEPQGKATYLADKGSLIFIASNLQPLDPAKTYELWIIPANGQAPVAAGTFHPDSLGNASVILPDLPKGVIAKAFGVTVEDEGGAKSPTMPILLSGAAAGV